MYSPPPAAALSGARVEIRSHALYEGVHATVAGKKPGGLVVRPDTAPGLLVFVEDWLLRKEAAR